MTAAAEEARISAGRTLRLIGRALAYAWPLRYRLLVKMLLSMLAVSSILILPWPMKVLIDHVVLGMPIGDSPTRYPPFVKPLVGLLDDLSPVGIAIAVAVFTAFLVAVMGAIGNGAAQEDRAQGNLSQGQDTATRSENQANMSASLVSGLLGLFEYRYQLRITHRLNHTFRSAAFGKLVRLPITRFHDTSIGDAVYRVMYDTPAISRLCYDLWLVPTVSAVNIGLVIWVTSYSFSAVQSVIWAAWALAPIALLGTLLATGLIRRRSIASRQAGAVTTATMEEGINNVIAVQSLGGSQLERGHFEQDSEDSFKRYRALQVVFIGVFVAQLAVIFGLMIVVFYDVVAAIVAGLYTPGDFAVMFAYFFQLLGSSFAIGNLWFNVQDNVAGIDRVFQVMDLPDDQSSGGSDELQTIRECVRIRAASYSYPDGTRALAEIDFEGHIGEMVALVGATGAGKSTLAYLLPGYLAPTDGYVEIDGEDASRYTIESRRAQVAFVFQEAVIFDDTVAGNIALGNPRATREEIRRAAEVAGAWEFIEKLPDGLDSGLGRGGSKLSVGQKQRIAIARGLIANAPVLVLDEPTASLDPETEAALVSSLEAERGRRLLVVIAHRLSTIRSADRIYFMEDGRVTETGTHDTLIARPDGAYRRFAELQFGTTH